MIFPDEMTPLEAIRLLSANVDNILRFTQKEPHKHTFIPLQWSIRYYKHQK